MGQPPAFRKSCMKGVKPSVFGFMMGKVESI